MTLKHGQASERRCNRSRIDLIPRGSSQASDLYSLSDDDFVGIDLDDCVNGDEINPDARAIINALDGYAEISPSLTGVKVWVRGKINLTTTGKKTRMSWGGDMEVYHRGRWFAVTGREVTP